MFRRAISVLLAAHKTSPQEVLFVQHQALGRKQPRRVQRNGPPIWGSGLRPVLSGSYRLPPVQAIIPFRQPLTRKPPSREGERRPLRNGGRLRHLILQTRKPICTTKLTTPQQQQQHHHCQRPHLRPQTSSKSAVISARFSNGTLWASSSRPAGTPLNSQSTRGACTSCRARPSPQPPAINSSSRKVRTTSGPRKPW